MDSWLPFFVAVTALAVVLQTCILAALLLSVRSLIKKIEASTNEIRARIGPILSSVQTIVDDVHPQINQVMEDVTLITTLARSQVQNVDRVVGEALDRLRMQLAHTDQILHNALESVEEAGSTIRRTVLGPVQSVTAVVRGIQAGLEFFRGNRRRTDSAAAETQDESLFI
jgi:hypothetical protein